MALLVEFGNELPQGLAQFDIHAGRGLVENDHRRLVDQRLRHQHPALHAAGELPHVGVGLVGQAQAVEQLVNPGVVVFHAEIAGLEAQRLAHVEKRVEHQFLGHHTKPAARLGVIGLHVVPLHQHPAAGGARQARQNADQGGLARTVGTEQAKKFAFFDVEADVVERFERLSGAAAGGREGLGDRLEGDGRHESP